jgi:hypothetical protein
MPPRDESGYHPVFYVTGAEFLERFWPGPTLPNMPLLLASLTLGPTQLSQIQDALEPPPAYGLVVGIEAWKESWPGNMGHVIAQYSQSWEEGLFTLHRFTGDWLYEGLPPLDDAVAARHDFGGNIAPSQITIDEPLWPFDSPDGGVFLGTYQERGHFTFLRPSFRISGQVVLSRYKLDDNQPLTATFMVLDATIPEGEMGSVIWQQTYTLSSNDTHAVHDYKVDTRGRPSRYLVSVDETSQGRIKAGFKLPRINHSDATPGPAPILRTPPPPEKVEPDALATALLPREWRDQVDVLMRGGEVTPDGQVHLSKGGELWLNPKHPVEKIVGRASLTASKEASADPVVRVLWYRGGRMEICQQDGIHAPDGILPFTAWPAEEGGWFGVLIDRGHSPHPVRIEIESISAR